LNRTTLAGVILGFAGAFLDFSSSYLILAQSATTIDNMGVKMTEYNSTSLTWGIGISVLGAVLIVTVISSLSSFGKTRMGVFGTLMIVFGVIMLLLGGSMFSGIVPMMEDSFFSSVGMFIVGALMVLNGVLMSQARHRM